MATLPLLISLADNLDALRNQFYDTDFGLGYHGHGPRHYMRLASPPSGMLEQLKSPAKKDGGAVSAVGKDGFQVCMNVQQFRPSDLTVKTVDNYVIVEGKHEERQDELGYISRHFVRKYALPDGYDPKHVVSSLSSDGVLTVTVPPPPKSSNSNERIVQIQQTGPAHLSVKDNPKEENKGSEAKK